MVSIKEVRDANAALSETHSKLTAVFFGATNGIGLATLKAFAHSIPQPKAIVVGRSKSKFAHELEHLRHINSAGEYIFFEAQISLIKNIDAVCLQIKEHLADAEVDILFESQGYLSFAGRDENAEGLDNAFSLRYYGRMRVVQNLMPKLTKNARVVSVLAGGQEAKMNENDLDLSQKGSYTFVQSMNQPATMTTLCLDYISTLRPDLRLLHIYPGVVATGMIGRSNHGILGLLFRWVAEPIMSLFILSPSEVGERMLFYATSEQYDVGSSALDWDGTSKRNQVLLDYRHGGWPEKVFEHTRQVFERTLAR